MVITAPARGSTLETTRRADPAPARTRAAPAASTTESVAGTRPRERPSNAGEQLSPPEKVATTALVTTAQRGAPSSKSTARKSQHRSRGPRDASAAVSRPRDRATRGQQELGAANNLSPGICFGPATSCAACFRSCDGAFGGRDSGRVRPRHRNVDDSPSGPMRMSSLTLADANNLSPAFALVPARPSDKYKYAQYKSLCSSSCTECRCSRAIATPLSSPPIGRERARLPPCRQLLLEQKEFSGLLAFRGVSSQAVTASVSSHSTSKSTTSSCL